MTEPSPAVTLRGNSLRGVGLYLSAVLMFAGMDAATKLLVLGLPAAQVMWARFTFHLLVIAIVLRAWGVRLPWWPRAPGLQVLRSLLLAACNLLFAMALVHVRLADATAIGFAGPVMTVALAAVWLRERVGWRRWTGVAVGLAGVLMILRPGLGVVHPAASLVLASAGIFAVYQILTRRLAGVDPPSTTIFQTGLWATLATSLAMPFVWVSPDATGWLLLVTLGVLGGFGHFLLVLAFDRAPASLIAPMAYAQLVLAVLFGVVLFGEFPDWATVAGALVITVGGLLVLSGGASRQAEAARTVLPTSDA